jgi:hypothetical protein
MYRNRGYMLRIFSLVVCLALMPSAWGSGEYPRIGAYWIDKKDRFIDPSYETKTMKFLSVADAIIVNPNPGIQKHEYRLRVAEARSINPELLVFPYINIAELNPSRPESVDIAASVSKFVNPNRGGANSAGDGWLREANGTITSYWPNNSAVNISDYVNTFSGGTTNEADIDRPMNGERTVDYLGRVAYFRQLDPVSDYTNGVFEDLFRRYPKTKADWDNDGVNEERNGSTDPVTQRKWREAHVRNLYNIVGKTGTGTGAPNARSNGRAWLQNGGYYLGNVSAWADSSALLKSIDPGQPIKRISEYDKLLHGGVFEAAFGLDHSASGLHANGTASDWGTASLDLALTSFNYSLSHTKSIPELGYSATILEGLASTLQMARYIFAAGLLTDGLVNVRTFEGSSNMQPPWILDEYVGGDINRMSNRAIYEDRHWLGRARDPAYPFNPRSNNGRVYMREFDNGLVVLLAGRADNDNHMSAVVTVDLPSPGSGAAWHRIDGGQDASWNNGQKVTSVTLGTSANNINKNAVVLRRVGGTQRDDDVIPKPPVLLSD